ncbi:MAG: phosphoenolpyruvate-protein phosphotransferase [Rhodospirillales bacterium]|nr:phosphoenolpyruvate-protein phosphotransferase [Rhodospirillales bacterium]
MAKPSELLGRPAAPGIATGPLFRLAGGVIAAGDASGAPQAGTGELLQAIEAAIADLTALAAATDDAGAEILEFQIAMLEDPALRAPALAAIGAGAPASRAWREALDQQIAGYTNAEDDYFRARAADLTDLRDRVLVRLAGGGAAAATPRGAILLGDDLMPSRFLEIDWSGGGGIALAGGSPTSHVAMLARARGVPMVVGLGTPAAAVDGHAQAAIDGAAGRIILHPTETHLADLARRSAAAAAARRADDLALREPAVTVDGTRISVMVNIADPAELEGFDPSLCDGIGLVRTELLFHGAGGLPDEDRQYTAYRRILEWAAGRPVTIRTLDAGGDKPIPGLTAPGESNPFLGLRGIRLSLDRPEIFAVQLRALARAAMHGALKVMLPMVTIPRELEAARALFAAEVARLEADGVPGRLPPLGMMVEVPAAALAIEGFDAAFFSIGSNDLIQYTTASARDSDAVAALADPRNPAVLRLIGEVARHGAAAGREVSLCGDMAGDPAYLPALLAAGLTALSVAPVALAGVKAAVRRERASHG